MMSHYSDMGQAIRKERSVPASYSFWIIIFFHEKKYDGFYFFFGYVGDFYKRFS